MPVINDAFIRLWEPQYDEIETDQEDYKQILSAVAADVAQIGTLTKRTFLRILHWKAPRLKGIVRLGEFESYAARLKESLAAPEDKKLPLLDDMYGIGAPLASTILHFVYPDTFPIIDVRTVETLHHAGLITFTQKDQKRYPAFRAAILRIATNCPGWSLRQIDKALFAYHKRRLKPRTKCRTRSA